MAYVVLLTEQSKKELAIIKKSGDKVTLHKIANLLLELQEHPRTGTGQVEHLKHFVVQIYTFLGMCQKKRAKKYILPSSFYR